MDPQTEGASMNSQTVGLRVAGAVFGLFAVAQLVRLLMRAEVLVAGHLVIPLWPSAVAFAIAAGLCFWLWRLSYRGTA
jgi:hypothetical protein